MYLSKTGRFVRVVPCGGKPEVLREALRYNAVGMIVVHNHPSGDATPSPEDVRVTERIVEAARLMDIDILDHLIIGHSRYVSLKERRLGF